LKLAALEGYLTREKLKYNPYSKLLKT